MSLIEQLQQQIGPEAIQGLSQQLGTDKDTTQSAVTQALPMIMGVLANRTGTRDGASSIMSMIDQEGDGILDDIVGFLSRSDNGSGPSILNNLLGEKRGKVEEGVSQMTNLDTNTSSRLLENLAPIVMGLLSKQKNQQGLNISAIAGLLGQEAKQADAGGAIGMLNNLLDQDGDGSMLDDAMDFLGGLGKR